MPVAAGTATPSLALGTVSVVRAYLGSSLVYGLAGPSSPFSGPTGLAVAVSPNTGSASVQWSAPTPPSGQTIASYSVLVETLNGSAWQPLYTQPATSTSTTLQLTLEQQYRIRVRATTNAGAVSSYSSEALAIWNAPQFVPSSEITLTGAHAPPSDILELVSDGFSVLALRRIGDSTREVWAYHHSVGWHKPALQGAAPQVVAGSFPNGVAYMYGRLFAYASTQTCGTPSTGQYAECTLYYSGVRRYESPSSAYPQGRLYAETTSPFTPAPQLPSNTVVTSPYGYMNRPSNTTLYTGIEILSEDDVLQNLRGVIEAPIPKDALVQTSSVLTTQGSGLVWAEGNKIKRFVQQDANCVGVGCYSYTQIGSLPVANAMLSLRYLPNGQMLAAPFGDSSPLYGSFDQGTTWFSLGYASTYGLSGSYAILHLPDAPMAGRDILFFVLTNNTVSYLYGLQSVSSAGTQRISRYGPTTMPGLRAPVARTWIPQQGGGTQAAIFTLYKPSQFTAASIKCWSLPYDALKNVYVSQPNQVSFTHFSTSVGAINGSVYAEAQAVSSANATVQYTWKRTAGSSVSVVASGTGRALQSQVIPCTAASTVSVTASASSAEDGRSVAVGYGATFTNIPADTAVDDGATATIPAPTLTSAVFGGPFGNVKSYLWEERLTAPYVYPEFWTVRSTASTLSVPMTCNDAYRDFRLTLTVARAGNADAVWKFPEFQIRVRPSVTFTQQPGDRSVCTACGTLFPASPVTSPPVYPSQNTFFRVRYDTCPSELAIIKWQKKLSGGQWQDIAADDPLLTSQVDPIYPTSGFTPDMDTLWVVYLAAKDAEMMGLQFRAKLTFSDNYVVYSAPASFAKSPSPPF